MVHLICYAAALVLNLGWLLLGDHLSLWTQVSVPVITVLIAGIGVALRLWELPRGEARRRYLRGSVNRRVNCDAANLDKAVEAAQVQLEAIRSLEQSGQLEGLPDKLRETARLRLEHPEDTLAELAALCDPPATKSALNHRLRKLVELGQARGEGAGHT